jgi:hypothetical protein
MDMLYRYTEQTGLHVLRRAAWVDSFNVVAAAAIACHLLARLRGGRKCQPSWPTRVPAPDRCQLRDCRAGSVKAVFACTSTGQVPDCGWPAVTDGLDGFCPPRTIEKREQIKVHRGT